MLLLFITSLFLFIAELYQYFIVCIYHNLVTRVLMGIWIFFQFGDVMNMLF